MTLALKYRPKKFDDLIGQEAVSLTLSHALDTNNLAYAYLFSGLRGSGKTSTARIFSKALLCQKGPTSHPCEECEHCKMANENRHMDIIEMDAASSRKIDDIRELIEHTKYKPAVGRYKIFIIDEVHMLTKEAFNALLKTLEEPPEYVKFILATTDPLKLPATILSRTQHFRFKKIGQRDIVNHLRHILAIEGVEYEEEALEILARSGQGSLRDTLTLLDQAILYSKGSITTSSVTSMLGIVDPKKIEEIFNTVISKEQKRVLDMVKELKEYESSMILDEMIEFLKADLYQNRGGFSIMLQERFFKILSDAKNLLFISGDDEFVLTLTLLKLIEATKIKSIDELIEEFESEELPQSRAAATAAKSLEPPKPKQSKDMKKSPQQLFRNLTDRLYEKNYQLGECFEKYVDFVSFEDGVLTWQSDPQGECKERLRRSYPTIKHLIQEIFGIDTKIKKIPPKESPRCDSTIEEAEFGSSCVSAQMGLKAKEFDDILKAPLVQKAKELFGAKKIKVIPKV